MFQHYPVWRGCPGTKRSRRRRRRGAPNKKRNYTEVPPPTSGMIDGQMRIRAVISYSCTARVPSTREPLAPGLGALPEAQRGEHGVLIDAFQAMVQWHKRRTECESN